VTHSNVAWEATKTATGSGHPEKCLQISFLFGHTHLWKRFTYVSWKNYHKNIEILGPDVGVDGL